MKSSTNGIEIIVDQNSLYEKPSLARKIFNHLFWFPFVSCLPKGLGIWLFVKSSKRTNLARKYSKTYKALELIYSYECLKLNENGIFDSIFSYLWESNMLNAYALRNRLKLVKKELKEIILKKKAKQKIRILSLASGSARAIIETLAEQKDIDIEARLVDLSRNALCYSRKLAEKYEVDDKINWFRANAGDIEEFCENWVPDIIEMVGLMDYLDKEEGTKIIRKIYKCLNQNGTLITSNINNNPERRFVREIANWDMIYRDPRQFSELLLKGGFNSRHCRIIYEPICIHAVATASKP